MSKYKVYDWTGKEMTFYGTHETFEDAWGSVYENFRHIDDDNELDQIFGEFEVLEVDQDGKRLE